MRIPALLAASILLVPGTAATQDLQYRMVMSTHVPQMPAMPMPTMTIYHKGSKVRVESEIPMGSAEPPSLPDYMKFSAIVDRDAGKMFLLDEEAKEFDERPFVMPTPDLDSAQLSAMSHLPHQFRETGDTLTIQGYKTRRFLLSMEMPFNPIPSGKKDGRFVMIMETWASSDAKLIDAYKIFQALQDLQSGAPGSAMLSEVNRAGFPVRNNVMMVNVPDSGSYDVESLLKAGAAAPGLQMRMSTEMMDIKTGRLDPALFEVPRNYTKR